TLCARVAAPAFSMALRDSIQRWRAFLSSLRNASRQPFRPSEGPFPNGNGRLEELPTQLELGFVARQGCAVRTGEARWRRANAILNDSICARSKARCFL